MSKTPKIQEGEKERAFGNTRKLKIKLQNNDDSFWIPESEVANYLVKSRLYVTESGTYNATGEKNTYNPVEVKVENELEEIQIYENGTYERGFFPLSPVDVNVTQLIGKDEYGNIWKYWLEGDILKYEMARIKTLSKNKYIDLNEEIDETLQGGDFGIAIDMAYMTEDFFYFLMFVEQNGYVRSAYLKRYRVDYNSKTLVLDKKVKIYGSQGINCSFTKVFMNKDFSFIEVKDNTQSNYSTYTLKCYKTKTFDLLWSKQINTADYLFGEDAQTEISFITNGLILNGVPKYYIFYNLIKNKGTSHPTHLGIVSHEISLLSGRIKSNYFKNYAESNSYYGTDFARTKSGKMYTVGYCSSSTPKLNLSLYFAIKSGGYHSSTFLNKDSLAPAYVPSIYDFVYEQGHRKSPFVNTKTNNYGFTIVINDKTFIGLNPTFNNSAVAEIDVFVLDSGLNVKSQTKIKYMEGSLEYSLNNSFSYCCWENDNKVYFIFYKTGTYDLCIGVLYLEEGTFQWIGKYPYLSSYATLCFTNDKYALVNEGARLYYDFY